LDFEIVLHAFVSCTQVRLNCFRGKTLEDLLLEELFDAAQLEAKLLKLFFFKLKKKNLISLITLCLLCGLDDIIFQIGKRGLASRLLFLKF
jgi:hypothetical protein